MCNRRLFSLTALVVLALSIIGAPQSASALSVNAPARLAFGCTSMTILDGGSFTTDRDNTGYGYERYSISVVDGAGTVLWTTGSQIRPIGFTSVLSSPGTTTPYTTLPAYNPLTLVYDSPAGNGLESQHLVFDSGYCEGLLNYASAAGCDQYVAIPSQAVGGQFVANAPVYYEPRSGAQTTTVIEAGNTYLVVGQDATGQFRKVLISCQWVWVPANTVGPNPQAPWNGAPLPTTVVN